MINTTEIKRFEVPQKVFDLIENLDRVIAISYDDNINSYVYHLKFDNAMRSISYWVMMSLNSLAIALGVSLNDVIVTWYSLLKGEDESNAEQRFFSADAPLILDLYKTGYIDLEQIRDTDCVIGLPQTETKVKKCDCGLENCANIDITITHPTQEEIDEHYRRLDWFSYCTCGEYLWDKENNRIECPKCTELQYSFESLDLNKYFPRSNRIFRSNSMAECEAVNFEVPSSSLGS